VGIEVSHLSKIPTVSNGWTPWEVVVRRTDGKTDMARSTRLVMLIKIYILLRSETSPSLRCKLLTEIITTSARLIRRNKFVRVSASLIFS